MSKSIDHKTLFIDIETVPEYEHYSELSEEMQSLWAYKSALANKEETDVAKSFTERAGIYSEFGKIVCIGVGFFYFDKAEEKFRITSISGNEAEILKKFFNVLQSFQGERQKFLCGHNIKEFDIPFICRRALILDVKLPAMLSNLQNVKPWESPLLDTLQLWRFGDYKNYVSLNLLAHVLKIQSSKNDIDGADVARVFYQEKNLERIISYCKRDVITTARIFRKLNELAPINDGQIENQ